MNNINLPGEYMPFDGQISYLRKKNIIIENEVYAVEILSSISYLDLLAGGMNSNLFSQEDQCFFPGTTLEMLYWIYRFDSAINSVLLRYILYIENRLKTGMSELIASKYGDHLEQEFCWEQDQDYLHPHHYSGKGSRTTLAKLRKKAFFGDHRSELLKTWTEEYRTAPVRVLLSSLSFGNVIEWYRILKPKDKEDISIHLTQKMDLDIQTRKEINGISLFFFRDYRNSIAHRNPPLSKKTDRKIHKHLLVRASNNHIDVEMANCIHKSQYFECCVLLILYLFDDNLCNELISELNRVLVNFSVYILPNNQRISDLFGLPSELPSILEKLEKDVQQDLDINNRL